MHYQNVQEKAFFIEKANKAKAFSSYSYKVTREVLSPERFAGCCLFGFSFQRTLSNELILQPKNG
jgi:hypothetical protein